MNKILNQVQYYIIQLAVTPCLYLLRFNLTHTRPDYFFFQRRSAFGKYLVDQLYLYTGLEELN